MGLTGEDISVFGKVNPRLTSLAAKSTNSSSFKNGIEDCGISVLQYLTNNQETITRALENIMNIYSL